MSDPFEIHETKGPITIKELNGLVKDIREEYYKEREEKGDSWREMDANFWEKKVEEEADEFITALKKGNDLDILKEGLDLILVAIFPYINTKNWLVEIAKEKKKRNE